MNWYLEVLKKYAVFTGRARRKEYWMFFLFNYIFAMALSLFGAWATRGVGGSYVVYNPLYALYALAVMVPAIAAGVRRMHDTGRSGWWLLVPLANLIFLIEDGTPGPNQYGPDPKGRIAGPAAPVAPAGWLPDPTGRHQYRYWDSTKWTSSVADDGVTSQDVV